MDYHERPTPEEYAPFYHRYVARLPDGGVVALLRTQLSETVALLEGVADADADRGYAPGKWSIKEVVGHVTDTERVMSYRALRIARGDTTELPGFEQDPYVAAANSGDRTLEDLRAELRAVRRATVALFETLPRGAWTRRGVASGSTVSVRALACIIAGHELHHRALLRERYGLGAPGPAAEASS